MDIKSWFSPKLLATYDSKFSGKVEVKQGFGYTYISTDGSVTQSGGIVKDVWSPVMSRIARKDKTWLILGLAGGTLVDMITHSHRPKKITGVEIDPMMVEIGKKYFGLADVKELEIVCMDAKKFLKSNKQTYDYVLVDMYCADKLPDFVYTSEFMQQVKNIGSTVVFNHLFFRPWQKEAAGELIQKLEVIFTQVKLVRKLSNLLLICT